MKFLSAWDSLEKENWFLKLVVFILLLGAIVLSITLAAVAAKDPLVIDRGCSSRVSLHGGSSPTEEEIKSFVIEAIRARFESDWVNDVLLSSEQIAYREKEQTELAKQKMKQVFLVSNVEIQKDKVVAHCDRIIRLGELRTAFPIVLNLQVKTDSRSLANPYGLILTEVANTKEVGE